MKILYANDSPSAPYYIRLGQCRALRAAGNNVVIWDIHKKCAFDAFAEFEPDLFIGQTYNVDRAVAKCIAARPDMKVALFASAYGELARTIDRKRFPIDIASEQEIRILEDLKKNTGRPDIVFIHCPDRFVETVLGFWKNINVNISGIMNGADIFSYLGGVCKPEYSCDISYIGGFWGYKSRSIKPLLLPICHPTFANKYSVKIFGNNHWNIHQYLGCIEELEVKNLFASSLINISISEPHSKEFHYDITEKPFKIPLSGFLISDNITSLKTDIFTNNECPVFSSANELMELIDYWRSDNDLRTQMMIAQKKCILMNHTYFHRMNKLMVVLDLPEEGKKLLNTYSDILSKLNVSI